MTAPQRSSPSTDRTRALTYLASGIGKQYGGVNALQGIDLEIRAGEVQALLGANGAGKSTLVKILVGAEQPSHGTLTQNGEVVRFRNVDEANQSGIAIVSQELNVFPDLDVLQNLFLQHEPRYGRTLVNRSQMAAAARPVMRSVGLEVALNRPVKSLRLAEQQLLEIARALLADPKILFLDEPTSALQAADSQRLLDVVRSLRDSGVAIVYVSHFLEDVFAVSDTITVLRNGRLQVHRAPAADMSIADAVHEMLGEDDTRPRPASATGRTDRVAPVNTAPLVVTAAAVHRRLNAVTLSAKPGEVVGLAGLEGSGAHTLISAIFGGSALSSGSITMPDGTPAPTSMTGAVRAGVAYVPADRKLIGAMLEKTIYENVSLVSAGPLRRMGFFTARKAMVERARHWRQQLHIAMPSPAATVAQLSGGNQQKVVFAKWLDTNPTVVLLDDPTRGVDVGAKVEMHAIIAQMAHAGRIVLITSTDLVELAEVSDRVIIFFQQTAVGELHGPELSEQQLLNAINTGRVPATATAP